MARFIESPRFPGRNAHNADMLRLFGVAGTKWPDAGLPPRTIQGITVWVEPIAPSTELKWNGRPRKSSKHRVMAECPDCKATLSAGRLHQHKCPPGIDVATGGPSPLGDATL